MGRQSHLARMALGRSPFDAPLHDDGDQLILGPNVQHDTARNYVQQFDSRGHPRNLTSENARRRLIRAQNDALATVGVVVRKARMNRTRWQTMTDEQKHFLLLDENVAGANCGVIEDLCQRLALRWIVSFRRRLLTFKSYLGLPVLTMLHSDWNTFGARRYLFAGYPMAAVASVSQSLRDDTLFTGSGPSLFRFNGTVLHEEIFSLICTQLINISWFSVEYSFYACSILQSLYLLPQNTMTPISVFSAFTINYPATSLKDISPLSWRGFLITAGRLVLHPFVLAYFRELCGQYLFSRIYILIRQFIIKPDRPDRISLQSSKESEKFLDEASIGQIPENKIKQRYHGPQTVAETIRFWFPTIFRLWERILQTRRAPLPVELSPDIEDDLIQRSSVYYRDLLRQNRDLSRELRRPPRILRMLAIRSAFNDYNLDPEHGLLDLEWADDDSIGESLASTSTPELQDLPPADQVLVVSRNEQVGNTEAGDGIVPDTTGVRSLTPASPINIADEAASVVVTHQEPEASGIPTTATFEPTVPLDTLLDMAPLELQESSVVRPHTPVPGLSRAPSLPHTTPRPVRRPTDIGESTRPGREELLHQQRPPRSLRTGDDSHYRVTILSNHPAETLAVSVASLVNTALMLPLDMLFLRSLARSFLITQLRNSSDSRLGIYLADVWPISPGLGGILGPLSSLRFWENWSLTLGMQGLVNLVIWTASTHFTLRISQQFGWGQF